MTGESPAGLRQTIRIHCFASTQDALDALRNDSTMIGDVIMVPAEKAIGVAVSPKRIFALTVATGAFTPADTAEDVVELRAFPAYHVARAVIAYQPQLYTWEGA